MSWWDLSQLLVIVAKGLMVQSLMITRSGMGLLQLHQVSAAGSFRRRWKWGDLCSELVWCLRKRGPHHVCFTHGLVWMVCRTWFVLTHPAWIWFVRHSILFVQQKSNIIIIQFNQSVAGVIKICWDNYEIKVALCIGADAWREKLSFVFSLRILSECGESFPALSNNHYWRPICVNTFLRYWAPSAPECCPHNPSQ